MWDIFGSTFLLLGQGLSEIVPASHALSRVAALDTQPAYAHLSLMLKYHSLRALRAYPVKPRQFWLDPVVPADGMVMMYAPAGTGKTYLGLWMAQAIASGQPFLKWGASTLGPGRVLYVDGELPPDELKARVQALPPDGGDNFAVLSSGLLDNETIPSLSDFQGQAVVEEIINKVHANVVFFDNKSCLFTSAASENEAASWTQPNQWLVKLRTRGVTTVLIHHAGKSGQQRGTSRIMDQMDLVMALQRAPGKRNEEGANFDISYDKSRIRFTERHRGFRASYVSDDKTDMHEWRWTDNATDPVARKVQQMHFQGMSLREIAKEMGISKSKVDRILKVSSSEGEEFDGVTED